MDLSDADLAKTLECAVCFDVFNEPKMLICGHTNGANPRQGRDRNCIKCPECNRETEIPPDGLPTNYRLVDLVCRSQKSLIDAYACNGCGERTPVTKMYTCKTCQEALNCKPIWICGVCVVEEHRDHTTSKCNKATQQQVQEACQGIASTGSVADMYVGITMSHLNRALKETKLISQLLNHQKRGFVRLVEGVKSAGNDLVQEDLEASLQEATDLKQKFEQASSFAKGLESVVRDCREKIEDLFPTKEDDEPDETEDSGASCNNSDLSDFDDGEEVIQLDYCRIDVLPNLSRFTELRLLYLHGNRLTSINGDAIHTTLTELDLLGNKITEIHGLEALVNLKILNIGYNRLRKIQGLTNLVKLERLCLEYNRIEKIEGLDTLVSLQLLKLHDNRIKAIEGLDSLHNLRELFLSGNRIRKIDNISHISKLSVLSIGGNRIVKLENLDTLVDLEKLYVADQGIETFDGIQKMNKLKLISADRNPISSLDHLDHQQQLEELNLYDAKISQWPEVDKLASLAKLRTVGLEGNPIETQDHDDYRRKVIQALQQVTKVDYISCR